MNSPSQRQDDSAATIRLAVLIAIGCLWAHLYFTVHRVWIVSPYYDFAWFVPPFAAFLFHRRWEERPQYTCKLKVEQLIIVGALVLFPVLVVIRCIEGVDVTWRIPMNVHAGVITLLTLGLFCLTGGLRLTKMMLPVIIFALSAIPILKESTLIIVLTGWVVESAGVIFHLLGRPVEVTGSIIEYYGTKVEVTEGCSGIQSFQSLVMVSLYFGEFFGLRVSRRIWLFGSACLVAIVVNIGRAVWLAQVRFTKGEGAFDLAHDQVGHLAFAFGSLMVFGLARLWLVSGSKKVVVRHSNMNSREG